MLENEIDELNSYYQSQLDGMASDQFKSDLIEVATEVFGEEFKSIFEENKIISRLWKLDIERLKKLC